MNYQSCYDCLQKARNTISYVKTTLDKGHAKGDYNEQCSIIFKAVRNLEKIVQEDQQHSNGQKQHTAENQCEERLLCKDCKFFREMGYVCEMNAIRTEETNYACENFEPK